MRRTCGVSGGWRGEQGYRLAARMEAELQARRGLVRPNGKLAEVDIVGHIALRRFEGRPRRLAVEQPLVEHGLEGRAGPDFEGRSGVDGDDGGIPPIGTLLGPRQHGARVAGVEDQHPRPRVEQLEDPRPRDVLGDSPPILEQQRALSGAVAVEEQQLRA